MVTADRVNQSLASYEPMEHNMVKGADSHLQNDDIGFSNKRKFKVMLFLKNFNS